MGGSSTPGEQCPGRSLVPSWPQLRMGHRGSPSRPPELVLSALWRRQPSQPRGGPMSLTATTPFPLPLHDGVGAGGPSDCSETHFRSSIDSNLTITTTHTHSHMYRFPWKRFSGKFPACREAEPGAPTQHSPPGLRHWPSTATPVTLLAAPSTFQTALRK